MNLGRRLYDRCPLPVQEQALALKGWQLRRRRFGARYRHLRRLLRRTETGTRAEVLALQTRWLRQMVARAARDVPYYREVFAKRGLEPARIRTAEDLRLLPVLTREQVRAHKDTLTSERIPRRALLHGHTSGSTGASLTLHWDERVDIATNAVLWRHREWAGVRFGERYASLLGRMVVPTSTREGPLWRFNRPWNQILFSSFHMDEKTQDAYVEEMDRREVKALEAYPSTAYVLARHLQARGSYLPLRAVFTSTEPLLPLEREVIEERLCCPVFDYLGAAERVVFAGECPEHRGLHLFDEYGVTEILGDDDEPLRPGETGRLVVTGLHNEAMPLIRYEIGDRTGIQPEPCPCGRPLPLLMPVRTKTEDFVVLPDGRVISPSVLTHPFKPLVTIAESQIVQESLRLVRVRIVPRATYDGPRDDARLMAALRERLGEEMEIRIEKVSQLERGPRGKFRWVISKVRVPMGGRVGPNRFTAGVEGDGAA